MSVNYKGNFVIIRYEASETPKPILVTGDDGNEYNVIPSDQF